jgi:hypothetical protein
MSDQDGGQDLDREAVDRAAAEAVAIVAASYLAEVDGRPRTRAQRQLQDRAARLARAWTRASQQGTARR